GGSTGTGPWTGGEGELQQPDANEVAGPVDTSASIEQSIGAAAAVVQSRSADLDVLQGDTTPGAGLGRGEGGGIGDGRGKGSGPGTAEGIPAYERWEIKMSATNLDEYAKTLDYFHVELGVAGGGNPNVEYITNLAAEKPTVRIGNPRDEHRLRFLHRSDTLKQADRQLAAKAGVKTDGRIVFQFYEEEMYRTLLGLEAARKGNRRISEVRRTVFGIRAVGGRYD